MSRASIITVVIPVYNRCDLVLRTLRSVAAQTYRPLRVILVDNNSTDASLEVLKTWQAEMNDSDFDITVTECATPGAAAARNAGLSLVATPWVMFFDSDDTMAPDLVASIVDIVGDNPQVQVIGWDVKLCFLDGTQTIKPFATKDLIFNCIINGTFATQRWAARTDIVRRVGGWNPDVRVWDDIELGARILASSSDLQVCKIKSSPMVDVYQTEKSITGMTYHANAVPSEQALDYMSQLATGQVEQIVNTKRIILAALYHREGHNEDASRLKAQALAQEPSAYRRMMLSWAYHYTAFGGRGAARILKILHV